MATERDVLATERDTATAPPPAPLKLDDASKFAYAALAAGKLPVTSYDKLVQSFFANGGDQSSLNDYVAGYSYAKDSQAASDLAASFVQKANYQPSELEKFDPSNPDFKNQLRTVTEKFYKDQSEAMPRMVTEALAARDAGTDATPAEQEYLKSLSIDGSSAIDNYDMEKHRTWTEQLAMFKDKYGATGGGWETFLGQMANMAVVPEVTAAVSLAHRMNVPLDILKQGSTADVEKAVREAYYAIPTQEGKDLYYRDVVKATHENSLFFTDFQAMHATSNILGPEGLAAETDPQKVSYITDKLFQALNIAQVAAGGAGVASKAMRGLAFRLKPALAQVGEANPNVLKTVLGEALTAPPESSLRVTVGSPVEVATTQFPHYMGGITPSELNDVKPGLGVSVDLVDSESRRIDSIATTVDSLVADIGARTLTPEARAATIPNEVKYLENTMAGVVRMGESDIIPNSLEVNMKPDESGLSVRISVGGSTTSGLQINDAADIARSYQAKGLSTRIYTRAKDGTKTYLPLTDMEIANRPPTVPRAPKKPIPNSPWNKPVEPDLSLPKQPEPTPKPKRGKYFVEVTHNYSYSPTDMVAYGSQVVNGLNWLGRFRNAVGFSGSWLDNVMRHPFTVNAGAERGLTSYLQSMIAPVRHMKNATQRYINDVMVWQEDFGRRVGRDATVQDLIGHFPSDELTPDIIKGVSIMTRFNREAYRIANRVVYKFLGGQRARTIANRATGDGYHGRPLSLDEANATGSHFYNPQTGVMEKLTKSQKKDLYDNGGFVIKSPLQEVKGNIVTTHIMYEPKSMPAWAPQPLALNPLKYVPGYRPRIYADEHIVERLVNGAVVDGVPKSNHFDPIYTVGSRESAHALVAKLGGIEKGYRVQPIAEYGHMDQTLRELQKFRQQGLIYGDRGVPLLDENGNPAEVIDPINATQAQIRTLSRYVAIDEFSKYHLEAWAKTYSPVVEGIKAATPDGKDITTLGYRQAAELMLAHADDVPGAVDAFLAYRYIYGLRGMMDTSMAVTRNMMVTVSNWYYDMVRFAGNKLPGTGKTAEFIAKEGRERIAQFDPFRFTRQFSYWVSLKWNPLKQFPVQSAQALFIAPLVVDAGISPYRWFKNSFHVLEIAHLKSIEQMGGEQIALKVLTKAAKDMGVSNEEMLFIADEFSKSGIAQNANIRNFAGSYTEKSERLAKTTVGDTLQTLGTPFRKAGSAVDRVGFMRGELNQVGMSWTAALMKHMKEKGVTDARNLTREDFTTINGRGHDFAGGMNRANTSAWQNNELLANTFQYMNYQHKALFTMLGLNGRAFTRREASLILGHQLIGFGAHGLPLMPLVIPWLEDHGVDRKWADVLNYGLYDIILNSFVNATVGMYNLAADEVNTHAGTTLDSSIPNPDIHVAQYLAPGTGMLNAGTTLYTGRRSIWNAVANGANIPWLAGASGSAIYGFYKSVKLAHDIVNKMPDDNWGEDVSKWMHASSVLLTGLSKGYSNFVMARLALRYGAMPTQSGQISSIKVSTLQALAKMMGMNSKIEEDYSDLFNRLATKEDNGGDAYGYKADAQDSYTRIQQVLTAVGEGKSQIDEAFMVQQELNTVYQDSDPNYYVHFSDEMQRLSANYEPQLKDIGSLIEAGFGKMPIDQHIMNQMERIPDLPEDQKALLRQMFQDSKNKLEASDAYNEANNIELGYTKQHQKERQNAVK